MKDTKYKAIMVKEETHKRFSVLVEYEKTHDKFLNELLNIWEKQILKKSAKRV